MRALVVAWFVVPAVAAAQAASGTPPAPASAPPTARAPVIREIERGFHFEGRGGFWSFIRPPALPDSPSYFSPGQAAQVHMGVDIGEWVGISAFILVAGNRMGSDYTGLNPAGLSSGDFGLLAPGGEVRVRVAGFNDGQGARRTWIYLRAAGAAVFYTPRSLIDRLDVMVSAAPGIEYFTKLRHFSIGLEAAFHFMVLTQSYGFSVMPLLKYSF